MLDHAEQLARKFHDTYERLAPGFGYETREDTKAFDPTTPNGRLMIAVCGELVPDPHQIPETFIDRLLIERDALQEKHEKLMLFLGRGAPGVSEMQRYLLPLQLCAMTMYGDILDRRLEDLEYPTGDLEPFLGPELNNVGMENDDD